MARVLVSQSRSPEFKTTVWLQGKPHPFILPRLIKLVPVTPSDSVVKSKLSPFHGSVALGQLNPIHKKGAISFLFFLYSLEATEVHLEPR